MSMRMRSWLPSNPAKHNFSGSSSSQISIPVVSNLAYKVARWWKDNVSSLQDPLTNSVSYICARWKGDAVAKTKNVEKNVKQDKCSWIEKCWVCLKGMAWDTQAVAGLFSFWAMIFTFLDVSSNGLATSGPFARLWTKTSIFPTASFTFLAASETVNPLSPAAAYLLLAAIYRTYTSIKYIMNFKCVSNFDLQGK